MKGQGDAADATGLIHGGEGAPPASRVPARVTSRDVARAAGVSQSTVSLVLKGSTQIPSATQLRVRSAMEALGYQRNAVAAALRSRRTSAVLFAMPKSVVHSHLSAELLAGATDEAALHGYCVVVQPSAAGAAEGVDLYRSQFVCGAVVFAIAVEDPVVSTLVAAGCPTVTMLTACRGCPMAHAVVADDSGGAAEAVRYLLAKGHRKIGLVAPHPVTDGTIASGRIGGAHLAAAERGARIDEAWVPDWTVSDGSDAGARLLARSDRPTAIFAISDALAFGVMSAVAAAGMRVPDDIAIVGFDNLPWSQHFSPPLTTVDFPVYSVGRGAVRRLLRPEEAAEAEWVPTRLIVRGSA